MPILHDLSLLPKSPGLLAEEFGKSMMERVLTGIRMGQPVTQASLDKAAMNCGRGELWVRKDPYFRAAYWLAHAS